MTDIHNKYTLPEDEPITAAEPTVAVQVGNVSGLVSPGQGKPFITDEFGRIVLSPEMKESMRVAEQEYKDGKCLSEEQFKQRFAKWL